MIAPPGAESAETLRELQYYDWGATGMCAAPWEPFGPRQFVRSDDALRAIHEAYAAGHSAALAKAAQACHQFMGRCPTFSIAGETAQQLAAAILALQAQ